MNKYYLKMVSFMALLAMAVTLLPANAAGVTVTASSPTDGEIDAADVDASGYATTTFGWDPASEYTTGTTISVTVTWGSSSGGTASTTQLKVKSCDTAPVTAFGAQGAFGTATDASTSTGSTITWTYTSTTHADPAADTMCIMVPVTSSTNGIPVTDNFSVSILTSGSVSDFGAVMFYVGGANDVSVTGVVPATLSFNIVETSDLTAATNVCDLGTLTSAARNQCDYRLKIQTNAQNGFSTTIQGDNEFSTGNATMTNITSNGAVATGTEGYGIQIMEPTFGGLNASTGYFTEPATTTGNYGIDDTPVPTTTAESFLSYSTTFAVTSTDSYGATTRIRHVASISGGTPAGYYQQNVTYRVTGNF